MRFSFACRSARRIGLAAFVLATVASPSVAHAFCRTTTMALPPNYSPSRGCFTEGLFLYWGNACVGYSLNQDASRHVPYADAKQIIDAAFSTWMNVSCPKTGQPPGITAEDLGPVQCSEVRYNGDTPNQNLIVFRDDSWPYQDPNSTLGLTTVTFNAENGEIYDADMEINASGRNLSITDQVPANGFDLRSVVTHEAGHFFGLAHAIDTKSTMYASYKPGTIALRTLTADDIAGICTIYPDASSRSVSPTKTQALNVIPSVACDPSPRHGLTSQCEVPNTPKQGCATSPQRGESPLSSGVVVAVAAGLLMLRGRTRSKQRITHERR
jgi:hypothetical protein